MKIIADKAIPFLQGVFEPYAEVIYKTGREINSSDVADADVVMTRTRTRCDAALLEGSKVSMIASATIGLDHVDLPWCSSHGIKVCNAPGCNANGVVQYVFSALYATASRRAISLQGATIGIIGVGNVGSRVAAMAEKLGFDVLLNDPPREAKEGGFQFCPLDKLLKNSDIVTMHVPLCHETEKMANKDFFRKMRKGAFFINSSRGEVVCEDALMDALPKLGPVIIDTWNNEPHINKELMSMVDIATPHIAGYSYQGKQNGTADAVRAVARHFGIEALYDFYPKSENPSYEAVKLNLDGKNQGEITAVLQYNYPIFTDDFRFRLNSDDFEELRQSYNYRNEIRID